MRFLLALILLVACSSGPAGGSEGDGGKDGGASGPELPPNTATYVCPANAVQYASQPVTKNTCCWNYAACDLYTEPNCCPYNVCDMAFFYQVTDTPSDPSSSCANAGPHVLGDMVRVSYLEADMDADIFSCLWEQRGNYLADCGYLSFGGTVDYDWADVTGEPTRGCETYTSTNVYDMQDGGTKGEETITRTFTVGLHGVTGTGSYTYVTTDSLGNRTNECWLNFTSTYVPVTRAAQ